jgi:chromosome segregation ATPase
MDGRNIFKKPGVNLEGFFMSEQKPARVISIAGDSNGPSRVERDALELKIAELTGAAEYLAQTIAISQGHIERLEKEIDDNRRLKAQAEAELRAQEEVNASKRREAHALETEIKKHEAAISHHQDSIRTLAETLDIAEHRYKQAIEAYQSETESKLKAIRQDYDTEKERLQIELENHRNQIQAEMKILTEEMEQNRKKQHRALEI